MVAKTRIEIQTIPEWVTINRSELDQHFGFLKEHVQILEGELAAGVPKAEYTRKYQLHDLMEICYDVIGQIRQLT